MQDLATVLRSGKVLVMDGAMGTELQRLTRSTTIESSAAYNLSNPALVADVHKSYLDAGADVLLTNTFQANPVAAASHADDLHRIWQAALRQAHVESARARFVLADVGPVQDLTPKFAADLLAECVDVDGILLETWSALDDLKRFAGQPRPTDLPLLVSFTYHRTDDLRTIQGSCPEDCARESQRCGVTAIGANCGKEIDMDDMLEIVSRYRGVCDLPIFVRPNAGTPTKEGLYYPHTPAAMAAALPALLETGIAMIGGCCGTTPDHVGQFRTVVDGWNRHRGFVA